MRIALLLEATLLVVVKSWAQAPLTIDPSFNIYITPEYIEQWFDAVLVSDVLERDDGTILVGGPYVDTPGNNSANGISLLINTNGDFVPSNFVSVPYGKVTELANGQYLANHRRWNHGGTIDLTWDTFPDTLDNFLRGGWHVFDDLSMLVGGSFTFENEEIPTICVIKLRNDGQLDTTWQVRHCDPYRQLLEMFPLRNGQFLIRGNWDNYEDQPTGQFVRINADGSPDLSFRFDAFRGRIGAVHELANGKLLMGGQFFMNNQIDTLKLVRLNLDGSLDTTFNNYGDYRTGESDVSGMLGSINVITKLDEERFVVGGEFDNINGEPRNCISCVDTLGNLLDCWAGGGLVPVSYSPGGFPYMWLGGFKQFSNGDWYMYGQYKGFVDENGEHPEQVLMSRLYGPTVGVEERKAATTLRVWPNPGTDHVQLNWPGHAQFTVTFHDAVGRVVLKDRVSNGSYAAEVAQLASGMYSVQVVAATGERSSTKWTKP
ncbi:MAG: T9SS type A sorting domain-containing protein [Flavobacteriales bacterium]|nr:T9SS type A sorting domain-containing protein [Flavobacteriales bacterium]